MVALNQIGQIAINVQDLRRASAFYREVLGIQHLFDAEPKMSFFRCGDVRLMLTVAEKPEFNHPPSILYYKVADIASTHRELSGRGVAFDAAPHMIARLPDHDLWMAFARDSENNVFALMSEVARA